MDTKTQENSKNTTDTTLGQGNTKLVPLSSEKKKPRNRCRKWVFTLNNWTDKEFDTITQRFKILHAKYFIGKEVGELGTPHLQGYVEFANATSFETLGALFNNRAHLEMARGKAMENINYCGKDGDYITNIKMPKPIETIKLWKKWQTDLETTLTKNKPNDRNIFWFWSEAGGTGKSSFVKYMVMTYDAGFINKGCYKDMINQVFNYDEVPEILLIDIPRNMKKISFSALEDIKNGLIANSKYETGSKVFNPPHIVVFCNFSCQNLKENTFSDDRIIEVCLDNFEF